MTRLAAFAQSRTGLRGRGRSLAGNGYKARPSRGVARSSRSQFFHARDPRLKDYFSAIEELPNLTCRNVGQAEMNEFSEVARKLDDTREDELSFSERRDAFARIGHQDDKGAKHVYSIETDDRPGIRRGDPGCYHCSDISRSCLRDAWDAYDAWDAHDAWLAWQGLWLGRLGVGLSILSLSIWQPRLVLLLCGLWLLKQPNYHSLIAREIVQQSQR